MEIRSKAPLRISFCGGGTDVSPYVEERGGVVLSTTIDKYAYGTLRPRLDSKITVTSLDYDTVVKYDTQSELLYDGKLDLVKAAINKLNGHEGLDLFLHSDAPPGSGLGSSSTMVVALTGLFRHWQNLPLSSYDVAKLAYEIERVDLAIKGGMQDQYAAAFGGFNFMEFTSSGVVVNPLRIPRSTLNELEYRLLLCYTGGTRLSANIINDQVKGYMERQQNVMDAMDELKSITIDMKNALLRGELDEFGALLDAAWLNKKRMAKAITTPGIDELYATAREHGALGGKILGAGGGGYLLLYCEFEKKHLVAEKLEQQGGEIVPFSFDAQGLETWEVNERWVRGDLSRQAIWGGRPRGRRPVPASASNSGAGLLVAN